MLVSIAAFVAGVICLFFCVLLHCLLFAHFLMAGRGGRAVTERGVVCFFRQVFFRLISLSAAFFC